ncbi:hypothetical protein DXV75_03095 [Alteromonas aestuariivivens]|uniref:Sulfotransferase domain-containing protein n=1 Tax=Alteromonas aestuariivivens TaxID=1938339 RepID=A0A3D8MCL8_9ALTE|nr:sulfotransferase domain-containing protein [Alteromonas aestuariivivens]RDV27969.1 hypothetical protein DXV75_03095 [Alteromonas aestuariivivens]
MLDNLCYLSERHLRAPYEVPYQWPEKYILCSSFPKSGNTWFRFIVGNILKQLIDNNDTPIDFHEVDKYSPYIRGNRKLEGARLNSEFPLLLKTHFTYVSGFNVESSIVLFRDPVKALSSYKIYLEDEVGKKFVSNKQFLEHWRYGINAWVSFHKYWLTTGHLKVVSYEELAANTFDTMKRFLSKFDLVVTDDVIEKAIENSSKEQMNKVRNANGDPHAKNPDYQFVSKSARKLAFSDEENALIREKTDAIYSQLLELEKS